MKPSAVLILVYFLCALVNSDFSGDSGLQHSEMEPKNSQSDILTEDYLHRVYSRGRLICGFWSDL